MRHTATKSVALILGIAVLANTLDRILRSITLRDRVVLITGGARGFGLCIARQFAAQGARLMLVSRNGDELDRAASELRSKGAEVATHVGDIQEADAPATIVDATIRTYGQLDVLVNNAGIITVGPLDNMTEADYAASMNTHFWAPLRFMTAARPFLKRTRGRIVNISSIGGLVSVPHLAPYSASKFALAGLSDAFRAELAQDGILVTSVFPGLLRTGSHIRARFKGQVEKEYSWFALGSASGLSSISADRAAHQVVEACRQGTPRLVISFQAKSLALAQAVFPNLTARILSTVASWLPRRGPTTEAVAGHEAKGDFPPDWVTAIPDRASRDNNELPADR